MSNDDFSKAEQSEILGDAAEPAAAATHYREAQRLLLPAGVVWTDRESYDRRMQAFDRIQQKLYLLGTRVVSAVAREPSTPQDELQITSVPIPDVDLPVSNFYSGLVVQITRSFIDYDGQEICAGEVLHFLDRSYFPYDSGHTLKFVERTIRLSGNIDEHEPIIANIGNSWFHPIA